jgi:hypothetical protein
MILLLKSRTTFISFVLFSMQLNADRTHWKKTFLFFTEISNVLLRMIGTFMLNANTCF